MLHDIRMKRSFMPQFAPQNFFWRFQLYYMLDFVASCNLVQYLAKLMMQPWGNVKTQFFFLGFTSTSS